MTLLLPLTNSAHGNLQIFSQNIKSIKQTSQFKKMFFLHVTNHVAQQHWDIGHANVTPSDYLDVEMSDSQQTLLNPTQKDVLFGSLRMMQKETEQSRK